MVRKIRSKIIHVQPYKHKYETIKGEVRRFEGRSVRTSKGIYKVIGITIDNQVDLQDRNGKRVALPLHEFMEKLQGYY
jgi:hypothetical protein